MILMTAHSMRMCMCMYPSMVERMVAKDAADMSHPIRVCVCMYVCVYICIYNVCIYVCIYIYIYMSRI